ncbi:polysaccharide biosynthesis protein [Sutcliffiella rhizosphaerae]|uniref:UDP-N-acetyl-alpha-D-glucosamine C6 dehydratase n=1 Tax=Sutcliffiella rhizosphaerae TaxID=2880967 RepID=A0ABN8A9R7_9BACI|nr:nucleoside-diphosphate sugar epimerase/dehydratase [Sutcliffiella rhizosphaerae]CAG9620732.1 UDP-N-acetyl-alpha-D-glucosamine C6 dehydratase [Sutcliffiella rhizosphaerae]
MSGLPRLFTLLTTDIVLLVIAIFIGNYLTSGFLLGENGPFLAATIISIVLIHSIVSYKYKLYRKAWEYASVGELSIIIKIVSISVLTATTVQFILGNGLQLRLLVTTWFIYLVSIGGSRFGWRLVRDGFILNKDKVKRTLIIGAGAAGRMVVRQLLNNPKSDLQPVGFIDDDPKKNKLEILGVPIVGGREKIANSVQELAIDHIVIAIPSLNQKELNNIFLECGKTKAKTQTLPMLEDLMTGKVSVNHFRDVKVEDLLGRPPIELDIDSISESITNRVILVTGAGGSIGSEICRQVAAFLPSKLVLLGHGENSIYSIEMELKEKYKDTNIEFLTEIADIQDGKKMIAIMEKHTPYIVYHAAAHKHVPLMERNPEEAVKNNIIGTKNVALAANWNQVHTFVMISSDKAVNPTSVMGATKRLAEMLIQDLDKKSTTNFIAVRFGNVLGSRGSVIPLFKKQILVGGPVTVTHPDMIRYFMTIPEASRLVIQAGSLAKGGEIFVLDMGEPVKILELAKNLIKLSGYSVDEIGIEYSGVRPGEKLFEELLNENEIHENQIHPKIYIGKTSELYINEIEALLDSLEQFNPLELKETLLNIANRKAVVEQKEKTTVMLSVTG